MSRVVELFPASRKVIGGTQWGYINRNGKWIISGPFDFANPFQKNGLAIVEVDGKNGVIDQKGRYVVKPIYDWISQYSEGLAAANDREGYRMIDESGRIVTKRIYDYIGSAHAGRVVYMVQDGEEMKYGYLDLKGNEIIPAKFQEAGDFGKDGKAVVRLKETEHALIDLHGKVLHTYPYEDVGPLSEGLLSFRRRSSDPAGYITEAGDIAIPAQYVFALPFEEGRAVVNTSGEMANQYGLIDRHGNYVIPAKYNDIRTMGEQRVAVGQALDKAQPFRGSVYAIANLMGGLLTEFKFQYVGEYHHGIASVSDGRMTYFIDRNGIKRDDLTAVEGNGTLSQMGDLVQANVDQRTSYYTRTGKLVWQQNQVIPLRSPLKVVEHKFKPNMDYLVYFPQLEGMSDPRIERKVNEQLKQMSMVKPGDLVGNGSSAGQEQPEGAYTGDFNVTFFQKNLLVTELNGYFYPFGAAHGMPSKIFAHINVRNGDFYSLDQLFKPNSHYVRVLSEIVGKQIKEDPQYSYVFPDSYTGIAADQPFYVKGDALYLYFKPYEIAPYVAGFPTFRIPFDEILSIIDQKGAFWRSFHR